MTGSVTDKIIKQINKGDETAFSTLYHAYYVYLNTIAIYYLRDENTASEIVNDVFVNIWNKRKTITYPIHSYLTSSVQNACISSIRMKNTRLRIMNEHKEQVVSAYERFIASSPQPIQDIQFEELVIELMKAKDRLPPQCSKVFDEYFFQGKSVSTIANEMEIEPSTVRVQIKNGREKVKELLKHIQPQFG